MKHCVTEDCPHRDRIYFESQTYCAHCGKSLESMPVCAGCGQPQESGEPRYCTYCGGNLSDPG